MKFFVAVVMLALAVSAQAGLVPLAYNTPLWNGVPFEYAKHSGQYIHDLSGQYVHDFGGQYTGDLRIRNVAAVARHSPLAYTAHSLPLTRYTTAVHAVPAVHAVKTIHSLPAVHAVNVIPAVRTLPIALEGNYVATTRGAVHTAPLPGHTQSATSINTEPAPGTW